MQYKEITNEINNIKNTKFNERTLRDLQILTKKINLCIKQQNLSNIEAFNIYLKLKKLINYKLTEVSAPKSKNLTNKLLPILNQNYNKIPSDITIIDNDLILSTFVFSISFIFLLFKSYNLIISNLFKNCSYSATV